MHLDASDAKLQRGDCSHETIELEQLAALTQPRELSSSRLLSPSPSCLP